MTLVPPQHIGEDTPAQLVKMRLGRFTRYFQDNPVHAGAEDEEPMGAGHQEWDRTHFPYTGHVGRKSGVDKNPYYDAPWQALWLPVAGPRGEYIDLPNVSDVSQDKKLEGYIGGIGTATITLENVLYAATGGGTHLRKRGHLAPLMGYMAAATASRPDIATLAAEWLAQLHESWEKDGTWEGRLAYAAQVTIYQGYGEGLLKTFTGLIEDIDLTSAPDRIVVTARDFGQVFTESHYFGWGKDPQIETPVIFVDSEFANAKTDVGYEAAALSAQAKYPAENVRDHNGKTSWRSSEVGSAETTEWVDIHLPEGVYTHFDIRALYAGLDCYVSLKPTHLKSGLPPAIEPTGGEKKDLVGAFLDANGWVDMTDIEKAEPEKQQVPGLVKVSYLEKISGVATSTLTRYELESKAESIFTVGAGTILRVSFRKLHEVSAGKFVAGVLELYGLLEKSEAVVAERNWITTQDVADVVRTLCMWAGFKEWDIPNVGTRLSQMITCFQDKSWMDTIKQICEGYGLTFFIADPLQDTATNVAGVSGEHSLGVPTLRKTRVISPDTEAEKTKREEGIEANGSVELPNRGSHRSGLPIPTVTDQDLLTNISVKQTNEPLSYVLRAYGYTNTRPGAPAEGVPEGQRVVYTLRPPWTGSPPRYADSRLGGILKQIVHHDPLLATVDLCRAWCWIAALRQALESVEATIEVPGRVDLDLDDHLLLLDLGTGLATRMSVSSRQSKFADGEKRKYVTTLVGTLIDTPDVADMVDIINGVKEDNGAGGEWADLKAGTGSSLGYGG